MMVGNYPQATWRLIRSPILDGPTNMAVDEAILQAVIEERAPTTIRLYSWTPPCISIGYSQPVSDIDQGLLKDLGWDLVRRPTGGKAILHTDELTYSIIGRQNVPQLHGGVLESYRNISAALLMLLHSIGIAAESVEKANKSPSIQRLINGQVSNDPNPICFETPSNYEITFEGKKIIGSAQARRKGSILQHGSLPLSGDLSRITRVLKYPNDANRIEASMRILSRATTVERALNAKISAQTVEKAFIDAFIETFNLDLNTSDLSEFEKELAEELVSTKHANFEWLSKQ